MEDDTQQMLTALCLRAAESKGGGVFNYIASDETQDNHGDVLRVKGWDLARFSGRKGGAATIGLNRGNPMIMWAHDYKVPPIGRGVSAVKNTGRLTLDVGLKFLEESDYGGDWPDHAPTPPSIRSMVEAKFLKGSSVGFWPGEFSTLDEEEDDRPVKSSFFDARDYTKGHALLELSVVPIPSNPNTLLESISKGWLNKKHLPGLLEAFEYFRRELNVQGLGFGDDLCDLVQKEIGAPRAGIELPNYGLPPSPDSIDTEVLTIAAKLTDAEYHKLRQLWKEQFRGAGEVHTLKVVELRSMIREEVTAALAPETTEQDPADSAEDPAPEERSMGSSDGEEGGLADFLNTPMPLVNPSE